MVAKYSTGDCVAFTGFGANKAYRYLYFVESTEFLANGTEMVTVHWIDHNGTAERIQNKLKAKELIPYTGPINQDRYCKRR
jgi:hypothetical protein